MFGVRFRSGLRLSAASFLACACANIVGIAGYEIDPALDERSSSGGEGTALGSGGTDEKGGQGGQESSRAHAGAEDGGSSSAGGEVGQAGEPAAGGMGGVGSGCRVEQDCDDEISCTVDSCNASGSCLHQPQSALCEPDADECLTCKVGIGCVAGVISVKELLLDNDFDDKTGDWEEYSETYPNIIGYDQYADTGSYTAQFGPAAFGAKAQEYADLFQYVTVPPNTLRLTFSGFWCWPELPARARQGSDLRLDRLCLGLVLQLRLALAPSHDLRGPVVPPESPTSALFDEITVI